MAENSTKPYLIRAIYEWCNDNSHTPYLAVEVDDRTHVPREYVKEGEIVLNVSPMATQGLMIGNDYIRFEARFGGVARQLSIPVDNISAIYARETGHGMAFDVVKGVGEPAPEPATIDQPAVPSSEAQSARPAAPRPVRPAKRPAPVVVATTADPTAASVAAAEGTPPADGAGQPRGGRSHLTRVK